MIKQISLVAIAGVVLLFVSGLIFAKQEGLGANLMGIGLIGYGFHHFQLY
jgi:hypothetical protein